MAEFLVLVNGLPGSGKTTLAGRLSAALQVPLISKDVIKESLIGVAPERAGVAAAEKMWELADEAEGLVVLESWWFRPRDRGFVESGLTRCGNPRALEVWCSLPSETALARVRARRRAAVHQDELNVARHWDDWVAGAAPLGLVEEISVVTDRPVDVAGLAERVRAMAART